MQDLNDKVTGGTLTATEWNEVPSEIQNVIEGLGITLSSGDLNQLGKAIAGYVANGIFYTDSGAANAYVLTTIGSKQTATAYTDGLEAAFIAGNDNAAGASTVNVAGLGVKNIKLADGTDPAAGEISRRARIIFDLANDRFELIRAGYVKTTVVTVSDASFAPDPDTQSIELTAVGAGGGGGGVDGQGAGTGAGSTGGAGGATATVLTSDIPSSLNITIGAGGTGGAAGNNNGTAGGATTVVSTPAGINLNAGGGALGSGDLGASGGNTNVSSSGGAATGGDINLKGGDGTAGGVDGATRQSTGLSGASHFGGNVAQGREAAGAASTTPGTGGGGSSTVTVATNFAGGDGADGIVIVREFF